VRQLTDDFVTTRTSLRVLVVGRDRHDITRVDLENDDLLAAIRLQVADRTEVQAVGARLILVAVDSIARHLDDCTERVVGFAIVHRLVVVANALVREELAVFGQRHLAVLEEAVQLVHCTLGRILHQVLEELHHRIDVEAFLHHREDSVADVVVNDFTVEADRTCVLIDGDLAFREDRDALGDVDQVGNQRDLFGIARLGSFDDSQEVRVRSLDDVRMHADHKREHFAWYVDHAEVGHTNSLK